MSVIQRRILVLLALAFLCAASLQATPVLVQRMDLPEICDRADRIFRGTVVSATNGTIEAGGGELPTVTYWVQVDEAFQGKFAAKDGQQFAEITMLASTKPVSSGDLVNFAGLELPQLKVGGSYVLMMSPLSAIGLSAPIGIGQGVFGISGKGAEETATNEAGDSFAYSDLAASIRSAITQ